MLVPRRSSTLRVTTHVLVAVAFSAVSTRVASANDHWSYQPPARTTPPAVPNADWVRNPIDAFVAAEHARRGLAPAAPTNARTLIRRLTFDLTGLPPTPEQVDRFVDESIRDPQTAISNLANRLLNSPEYGVRWARHWLDTVRYTDYLREDPLGVNKAPEYELYEAFRYRDWVVDALNADLPYDDFVRHQIAGDLLPNPNGDAMYPEGLIATTVLSFGFWENGCADKKKVVSDIVDDQIDVVGKAFLGLTLACARCHDHKFDPLTQEDYYGLAGIFYSSSILKSVGTKGGHTILLRTPLESPDYLERRQQALAELAAVEQEIAKVKSQLSVPAKMVAWFDFEENSKTTTADNVGGYVGTLHGDAVIGEGRFGHGVTLDGDGDFVDGTARPEFQVKRGTIMAWFRFDADTRGEGQIAGMPFHTTKWTEPYYALQAWISPDGKHLGSQANHDGTRIQTLYASHAGLGVGSGEWHHIAAVYDGRFARLFVDGRQVGAAIGGASNDGSIRYDGNPNLTIGTRNVIDVGNFFKGSVDEVKLFDGALNANQIRAAMKSPVPEEFAVAFRDGTISPSLAKQQAKTARKITELKERARKMRAALPPEARLAMAIREGGTHDSLFPGCQDVPLHLRGRYDQLGEVVPRRMPQFLAGPDQPPITRGSGRQELAEWIASADNPLTARVIVNRVWQHHFGQGLVGTANNFGVLGDEPTHPELLNWLALWFIDEGWSLKKLHRLIVTSSTYQQSTWQQPDIVQRDADNHLLTRMPSRRLESEPIRDAMLAVAGRLDLTRGGPAEAENDVPRRSLYIQTRRFDRNEYAMLFDCANPEQSVAQRSVSTTAPQALFLLNNAFVKQQSRAVAARLAREVPEAGATRVQRAYELLFARPATDEELAIGEEFIAGAPNREQGWNEYAQLLLASNEFFYVE
jgi:hypothetical protein